MVAVIEAVASLLKSVAWPIAAVLIMFAFRAEVRLLLPRLRKAGLTSVEFDAAAQQAVVTTDLTTATLKQLPGVSRTEAIKTLELSIRENLNLIPDTDRLDVAIGELALARLSMHFERVYHAVFGSQIVLLRRLHERGAFSLKDVEAYYESISRENPDIYSKYSFSDWVKFLSNEMLVFIEAEQLHITPVGRDFLLYMTRRALPETKAF